MPRRVALVTATTAAHLDDDLPLLVDAFAALGIDAVPVPWDDAAVEWGCLDGALVRSPWDYVARRAEFLAWTDAVVSSTPLWNPPDVLRWNTDKRYLLDLARAGVPIVPTTLVPPGRAADMPTGTEVVVKPAVGAGSVDAERFGPGHHAAARAHVARLHAEGRTALWQPYVASVEVVGEAGLVFLGGRFSHAIRKAAMLEPERALVGGLYREEQISARPVRASELDVAHAALTAVPGGAGRLVYARVDLVTGDDGEPQVLEVEVTEPSLFLGTAPGSAGRLARAVCERLGR